MKHCILVLALFVLAAAPAASQGCNLPNCHNLGSASVWDGNGGPFLTGHTYVLQVLTVPAGQTLTVQPGAILKFDINVLFRADVYGTMDILGTAAQPVIITSLRDDVGGDHNGDGNATSPAADNWGGLNFYSSSTDCDLDWCEVRYSRTAIEAYGPTAVPIDLRNVTTKHTTYDGFYSYDSRPGVVDSCAFDDGQYPVRNLRYYEVQKFTNCTASGNSMGNDMRLTQAGQSITMYGTRTWTTANTLNGSGVVICWSDMILAATSVLTLDPGMVIKMEAFRSFIVYGELHGNGTSTAPVIFTSVPDDSAGGDSDGNGPSTGSPGDWYHLTFQSGSDASTLTWTEVRYTTGSNGAVDTWSADIALTNCRFADSAGTGLRVSSGTTVTGCAFEGNATAISPVPITSLTNFSGNTASGNLGGDVMALGSDTVTGAATLGTAAAFNGTGTFALRGTVTVGSSGVLTIDPGVIIKGDPAVSVAQIKVHGTLNAGAPAGAAVVFTSFRDDSHGGDTNGDGNATSPAAGDWHGLRFHFSADASTLQNALVRYAGKGGSASVWLDYCDMVIDSTTIEHGAGAALSATGSLATVTDCAFDHSDIPLENVDLDALAGFSGCTATGNTQGDVIRIGSANVNGSTTLTPAGTLNGTGVLVFDTSITVGGDLTLEAGLIAKFSGSAQYGVYASGVLTCNGTAAQPVVFTSLADDAFGGDSAGDGPSTGSPGDWKILSSTFGTATLTHTHVRFAGGGEFAAVTGGGLDLTDCVIEKSESAGIDINNNGNGKTVTNCQFIDTTTPIIRATIANLSNLSGNTASGSTNGEFVRVTVPGSTTAPAATIDAANTINGNGIVHVHGWMNLWGPTVVGPGVIFKFRAGGGFKSSSLSPLTVNGSGTYPVVFTSWHDDSVGGADNDATAPAKGDWKGLELSYLAAGDSAIDGAIVRWAGEGNVPAIDLDDADVSFCELLVENCLDVALDASFNSSPVLKGCTFLNNCGAAIDGITWAVLANMTGVTASGNGAASGYGNATTITSDVVDGDLVIERDNYFGSCIVVTVSPNPTQSPTQPSTLRFGRGVAVKCLPGVRMKLNGVEGTAREPVVFTSITDDSIGGDTNGDGTATTPLPGDWGGVSAGFATVRHALVRYAGESIANASVSHAGLEQANAFSCRVEHCAGYGFMLSVSPGGFQFGEGFNLIAFKNQGIGIHAARIANCTSVLNDGWGINARKAAYCISWNNGSSGSDNYTYSTDITPIGPPGFGTDPVYCCGTSLTVGPPTGGPLTNPNSNCGNTGWGNIDADPLFVDEANGDLRLSPASPVRNYFLQPCPQSILTDPTICTPWGITGASYPEPPPRTRDFLDGPRPSDDDLAGPNAFLTDLGAYEARRHELVVLGDLKLGATTTLLIAAPPGETGTVFHLFGESAPLHGLTDLIIPGWGVALLDPASIVQTITLPYSTPLAVPIPYLPSLAGLEVDAQAIVLPTGAAIGAFTEVFRGRFHY